MKRFFAGLAAGLMLGSLTTATAASVLEKGILTGWDVTTNSGKRICSDPYVWPAIHEIECQLLNVPARPAGD